MTLIVHCNKLHLFMGQGMNPKPYISDTHDTAAIGSILNVSYMTQCGSDSNQITKLFLKATCYFYVCFVNTNFI